MTLGHGPKIATNGLVFAYDMDSIRSYNGPQTTNSATGIVPVYNTETSLFTMYPTYEDVYVPQIGWVRNCLAMTMYNDYNGGSGNCCPSPILYYTGGNTTTNVKTSTLYTYAIVYKSTNGYTHPNFMYRYEYGPSGYLTEGGIHNTSNRIHLGNDWYWAWGTFTTQSATTYMTPRCFQYQYATWNKLYLAKVMLIEGNYTGLHPKFWPNLSETINSTNSILDWSGNNTITVNSLTYNSDGTFSFNGTDNYITTTQPNVQTSPNNWTVEGWIKPGNQTAFFITPNSNGIDNFLRYDNSGKQISFNVCEIADVNGRVFSSGVNTVPLNTWSHFAASINNLTVKIHINGELKYSGTETISMSGWTGIWRIGQRGNSTNYLLGDLNNLKVYNRELSTSEVARNFEALRGRYGI